MGIEILLPFWKKQTYIQLTYIHTTYLLLNLWGRGGGALPPRIIKNMKINTSSVYTLLKSSGDFGNKLCTIDKIFISRMFINYSMSEAIRISGVHGIKNEGVDFEMF